MNELVPGDHIYCERTGGYAHHGIFVDDHTVIHYSGEKNNKKNASVKRSSFNAFCDGDEPRIVAYEKCLPPADVCKRAASRLGEIKYNLVLNNCEHFARWCKGGFARSTQVSAIAGSAPVAVGGAQLARTGGTAAISVSGTVAGLSGAGIMSGLATVGSVVGGGALAGIGILGAAPAIATTVVMQKTALRDDKSATPEERRSRKTGRRSAAIGAAGGTAGAVGTGAVVGVGPVGLATIGSVVGGGMLAGAAILVAAPAAVAGLAGLAGYVLSRRRQKRSNSQGS